MPLPGGFATRKWQRTQVREASRSRASDSPVPGEGTDVRTARPVGEQYRQRTRQNVIDSDGTAILFYESLRGGTKLTRDSCVREKKLFIVLDAKLISESAAAAAIVRYADANEIQVLNVAGPRLSGWPQGHGFAMGVVGKLIGVNE
jgi:hypothetical protein